VIPLALPSPDDAMAKGPPEPLRARFERLARSHGPAIGRTARSYARDVAEREDLEQDIALAVWRALPSFRGECAERTFVLRIAHNQALSFVARRRGRLGPTDRADDARAAGPDPEVLAGLSERMRAVFQAIHALPFGQRQVLVLALEGLAHEEIGQVLGVSVNNVAVRVSRARAELRRALGEGS
jgi:RNA polymerase sigma-70 factor (ECF subfamily)